MQATTQDYFVTSKMMQAQFRFQYIPPLKDDGKLLKEMQAYFTLPRGRPHAAPWSIKTVVTEGHLRARETYDRIMDVIDVWKDPEVAALNERIEVAQKRGETEEVKSLNAELRKAEKRLKRTRVSGLLDAPDLHRGVIEAYLGALDAAPEEQQWSACADAVAPFLGEPVAGDLTYASEGYAFESGLVVAVTVTFADPVPGAQAFTQWLTSRGCTRVHYDLEGAPVYEGED
jgi:hypothetical protein